MNEDYQLSIEMEKSETQEDFIGRLSDLSFMTPAQQKKEIASIKNDIEKSIKSWEAGLYGASMAGMSDKHREFTEKIMQAKKVLLIINDL